MSAIYNEIEPFAVAWMRELIARGHIAPGVVNEQSIADLAASDVAGPGQRHFFAGIGVWSYALRLAGVRDDANIWTGSCPCQPFSTAGRRGGFSDERHLWPVWFGLIRECRPSIVFGEQVAGPDGLAWLDAVFADLEGAGYACAAADLCAAGVGAPHIRQRLYFVAYADSGDVGKRLHVQQGRPQREVSYADRRSEARDVADAQIVGRGSRRASGESGRLAIEPDRLGATRWMGNSGSNRSRKHARELHRDEEQDGQNRADTSVDAGATRGFWRDAEWVYCRDGKWRPVEPGTFPLAYGAPARVGRLRACGNAIVSEQAATFIEAALGALP